jgi:MFS family permease
MAVGPTLGGLLVDHLGWRSVFFLVVPFGIVVIAFALWRIAESSDPKGREIDVAGQIFAFLFLGCLAFGFIQGPSLSWSSSVRGLTAVVAGLELLPMSVTFFIVSMFASALSIWLGQRYLLQSE